MELNLAIFDYTNLALNVEKDLKGLQSILKDSKDIPEKVSYAVFYLPDISLSIKQTEPVERIIWENGKQTRYKFNNQCYINSKNYYLKIQFNELEKLISDSLTTKLKEVIDSVCDSQSRKSTIFNYSFQGKNMIHQKQLDKITGQSDVITLKGGIGVNFIKNKPIIDLSAEMGFMFSKKGIYNNQFYVSYNQLSDFGENSKVYLNSFTNIGYRHNLSNTAKDPNWLGLEFGYLTSKNGEMFGKNTCKFGINWEIGKYMSVSPQLILSDNFKELYPALRIGFGF